VQIDFIENGGLNIHSFFRIDGQMELPIAISWPGTTKQLRQMTFLQLKKVLLMML
jgi:hypothetical protein